MQGVLSGQKIITLLDTGVTHNFIDTRLVERRGILTEKFEGIRVKVVDGFTLRCDKMISKLPMRLNNYEFKADFYVVNMGEIDMVLGMTWLHDIGIFTLNLCEMEMRFEMDGKTHMLKALKDTSCKTISLRKMEHLLHHDMVEWVAGCVLNPTQVE